MFLSLSCKALQTFLASLVFLLSKKIVNNPIFAKTAITKMIIIHSLSFGCLWAQKAIALISDLLLTVFVKQVFQTKQMFWCDAFAYLKIPLQKNKQNISLDLIKVAGNNFQDISNNYLRISTTTHYLWHQTNVQQLVKW